MYEKRGFCFLGFNIVVTGNYCFAKGARRKKSGNVQREVKFFMIFKDNNIQRLDFLKGNPFAQAQAC